MTEAGTEIELSREVLEQFAQMASALDEFDTEGMDGIMKDIFAVNTVADYNRIFEGDRELPEDKIIQVDRVRYARSEFAAGLPFYLVIDGVDVQSGEVGQWVTGATTIVAMLTRAAFAGHLPCVGFARKSKKPTKNGYTPVNWHMREIKGGGQQVLTAERVKK